MFLIATFVVFILIMAAVQTTDENIEKNKKEEEDNK